MTEHIQQGTWINSLRDPSACRVGKPRTYGITMILDKGLGIRHFTDLIETSADHIDYIKLGFGTAALYPPTVLEKKLSLAIEHDLRLYPGGTFFEVAYLQGKVDSYFEQIKQWGFETVEISDGTITLSRQERDYFIEKAKDFGFEVITECGKKIQGSSLELMEITDCLFQDLHAGAKYMIVEGRESGENVGLYNSSGEIDKDVLTQIQESFKNHLPSLIWETPKKQQQAAFIQAFGPNINLGNIAADEVFALEALRRGLRSDTMEI